MEVLEEDQRLEVADLQVENQILEVTDLQWGHRREEPVRVLRPRDQLKKPSRFTANLAEHNEPLTFKEAMEGPDSEKWKIAINEELESLRKNGTWVEVPKTPDMNIVGSKWVFKIKTTEDKNNPRFKSRLCAKGYTQKKGVDYEEIFSPTTRYDSIRILLALAIEHGCQILQFDVKTAFLHGDLKEILGVGINS